MSAHVTARLLRLAPPRRTPFRHQPTTYPQGYSLTDLGPAAMLDHLNRTDQRNDRKESA